jgi:catechol 2,3-dioxygenase-like lactoylglutathione lyase family enzyme
MSNWSISPVFLVDDVVATAEYYRDKLGFHYDRVFGEPPAFCMVRRGGAQIMLSQPPGIGAMRPNRVADPAGEVWDAYVYVDDADALCEEYRHNGVTIVREPCDQPYHSRDFEIEDWNGYRLCFGHDL